MKRLLKVAKEYSKQLDKALGAFPLKLPPLVAFKAELILVMALPSSLFVEGDRSSAKDLIKGIEELNHYIEKHVPKILDVLDSWFHNPSNVGISETEALSLVEVVSGLISVPCDTVTSHLHDAAAVHESSETSMKYLDNVLKQTFALKHIIPRANAIAAKVFAGAEYDGDLSVLAQKMATSSKAKARAKIMMDSGSPSIYVESLLMQGLFLDDSDSLGSGHRKNIREWMANLSSSMADMMRFMIEYYTKSEIQRVGEYHLLAKAFSSALMVCSRRGVCFQVDGQPEPRHQIVRIKDIKLLIELQIEAMEYYIESKDPSSVVPRLFNFGAGALYFRVIKLDEIDYLQEIAALRPFFETMINIWIESLKVAGRSIKGSMRYATTAYISNGLGVANRTQPDILQHLASTLIMHADIIKIAKIQQLPLVDSMDLFCLIVEDLLIRPDFPALVDMTAYVVEYLQHFVFVDQKSIEVKPGTEFTSSLLRLYQATWRLTVKLIKAYSQVDQIDGSKQKAVGRAIGILFLFHINLSIHKYLKSDLVEWKKDHFDLVLDCCRTAEKVARVFVEPATRLVIIEVRRLGDDNITQGTIEFLLHSLAALVYIFAQNCLKICSEEDVGATKYLALALHLSGLGELIFSVSGSAVDGSVRLYKTSLIAYGQVIEMFPFTEGHVAINYRPYCEAVEFMLERPGEYVERKGLSKEEIKYFYYCWNNRSEDDIRTGALMKAAILAKHSQCANPACVNVDGFAEYRLKRNKCSACNVAFYCSKACQKAHWKSGHKQECSSVKEYFANK